MDNQTLLRFEEFFPVLRKNLKRKRFLHSLGVMHFAAALAARHGEEIEAAAAAGLFHDCGRLDTIEEVGVEINRRGIRLPDEDHEFDKVWHALVSADIAATDFGITDARILRAIRVHPTADDRMSRLDMIVFMADYVEPTRRFDGVKELRILALRDLEASFRRALEVKTHYIVAQGRTLHPRSLRALAAYGGRQLEVSLSSPPETRHGASPA